MSMKKNNALHTVLAISICMLFVFVPLDAEAQFMLPAESVALALTPQFPSPNSVVSVHLTSFGTSINGASISWAIDGKIATTSANQNSIDILLKGAGESTVVEANVTAPSIGTRKLSRTIAPGAVDIIVEPNTHVPEGYQGRALPSVDSYVRIVAVPQLFRGAARIDKKDVLFTWSINGNTLFGGAQLGTDSTTVPMPRSGVLQIDVIATSKDTTRVAKQTLTLRNIKPLVRFYEDSSLFGMILNSPASFIVGKDEITLRAEPYYLPSDALFGGRLAYTWTVDGTQRGNTTGNTLTLERASTRPRAQIDLLYTSTDGKLLIGRGTSAVSFVEPSTLTSF